MNKVRQNSNREIQSESKQNKPKLKKIWRDVGKVALVSAMLYGGSKLAKEAGKQIFDGKNPEDVAGAERIEVESVTIHGGPNLRSDPYVPGDPNSTTDKDNLITDLGDSDQEIELSYKGDAYVYDNPNDSNGAWYGFQVKPFADALSEESLIDEKTKNEMYNDADGWTWVSGNYVSVQLSESTGEHAN